MKAIISTVYGPDINTDDIIRADILQEEWEKPGFATYAFDKFDPDFRTRCAGHSANVIIAGSNFGSGSSREQAVYAIRYNNVAFVVAQKDPQTGVAYPDIFYRNAVNNDLPLITLDSLDGLRAGDELDLDLAAKTLTNVTTGKIFTFDMSQTDIDTLQSGGLIGKAKQDIRARLSK